MDDAHVPGKIEIVYSIMYFSWLCDVKLKPTTSYPRVSRKTIYLCAAVIEHS